MASRSSTRRNHLRDLDQRIERGFLGSFADALAELAPELRYYRHDDLAVRKPGIEPDTAGFPNVHSHIRAGLLASSSQVIPSSTVRCCSALGSASSSASSIVHHRARSYRARSS
jgi:hypothetical protein